MITCLEGDKNNIAQRWKVLSGEDNWTSLLDPLDIDLRRYIIHYGEMAQATYDTFNSQKVSEHVGHSLYASNDLFRMVGLEKGNPFKYKVTKYLYATSSGKMRDKFFFQTTSRKESHKETNWIGFVAVATNKGKLALGRRDIVIAWRGTVEETEWVKDLEFKLVPASIVRGEQFSPRVHHGWYSMYTSVNSLSSYSCTSARNQVIDEVKRLMEEFKHEETSITIVGHSLGAALATLNAADIVSNELNKPNSNSTKACLVTAITFASPRVGDSSFKELCHSLTHLRVLRIRNSLDVVPHYPLTGYHDVGKELTIKTSKSKYLKAPGNLLTWHNLEAYLHGVAGTQGVKGGFELVVKRDIALVNKHMNALKEEYRVPGYWKCDRNKGMVQLKDGSWKLMDRNISFFHGFY
ncbi:phospholipase A1-II 1-like [Impatiens glandulifera]|uniref:phospholipase A1-II 1-like n=1 Tax=Impatiens glandulifera TaxID=253017 RepID=UPI001FB0D8C2|nr:phospholipase A1-II 1-like [Impatiens glandulifera]